MKVFRLPIRLPLPLSLGALLLALVPLVSTAEVFPVRHGDWVDVFGKEEKDLSFSFSHPKARQLMAFAETSGAAHPKENCFGSACYSPSRFTLAFFVQGERLEEAAKAGGSISFALYTDMANSSTGAPPIMIDYTLEPFPALEPGAFYYWFVGSESRYVHSDPFRHSYATPSYGARRTPLLPGDPEFKFRPFDQGWALLVTFPWHFFAERLPFRPGEYPVSWRLVARRTRDDGTIATWGTDAAPVVLSWGRPGDEFLKKLTSWVLIGQHAGPTYHDRSGSLRIYWSCYKEEQWMGYLDAGRPTFETKNPASDGLFYERCVAPLLDRNANIDKALYYNDKENIQAPVRSYSQAECQEIMDAYPRIVHVNEIVGEARRDYLLRRFLDEPVPQMTVETKAKPKKLKKLDANREMSTDDLGLDAMGDDLIELDDVGF